MRCPSGDQRGVPLIVPASKSNPTALEPSVSVTQMPKTPLRLDSKASLLPSGEYCAAASWRVEAMNCDGKLLATPGPDNERRHTLVSMVVLWYARRLPLRETAGSQASPALNGSCSG